MSKTKCGVTSQNDTHNLSKGSSVPSHMGNQKWNSLPLFTIMLPFVTACPLAIIEVFIVSFVLSYCPVSFHFTSRVILSIFFHVLIGHLHIFCDAHLFKWFAFSFQVWRFCLFFKNLSFLCGCGMQTLVLACGICFPDQESNLSPLHWEHGVLATGPPGKFLFCWLLSCKVLYVFLNTNPLSDRCVMNFFF